MLPKILKVLLIIFVVLYLCTFFFHSIKPLPQDISYQSQTYTLSDSDISFLVDMTYQTPQGRVVNHTIFETVFSLIDSAQDFLYLDMFLYNTDYDSAVVGEVIPITTQLTESLVTAKKQNPHLDIIVTSDSINTFYGSYKSTEFELLRDANITVLETNLKPLRDSNPLYSSLYRLLFSHLPFTQDIPFVNLFGGDEKATVAGLLTLLNFKANHRKLLVTKRDDVYTSVITSANPHEPSSFHSNIAFVINHTIANDVLRSEQAIVSLQSDIQLPQVQVQNTSGPIELVYMTEQKIADALLKDIQQTQKGDSIFVAAFYLSQRGMVEALLQADRRGVDVRLVLDANKDAFGQEKAGIPNRQVAFELVALSKGSIQVKWYNTQGEQFHMKLLVIHTKDHTIIHAGSSNFTRRNLDNYNLEANVRIQAEHETKVATDVTNYLHRIWYNIDGQFTLSYDTYKDHSLFRYILYRIQERTGLSTF